MLPETIYKKKEEISSRRLGNDLMLYDEATDKVHILNETGALIWELLDGKNNLLDIENLFIKQFPDAKPEEISRDINEVVEKLLSEELIMYTRHTIRMSIKSPTKDYLNRINTSHSP